MIEQKPGPVIGSYVHYDGKMWNVSTIYRECSAIDGHGTMYFETMVWEWDSVNKKRGKMVHQGEKFNDHFDFCREIIRRGAFWEQNDDED